MLQKNRLFWLFVETNPNNEDNAMMDTDGDGAKDLTDAVLISTSNQG